MVQELEYLQKIPISMKNLYSNQKWAIYHSMMDQ